MLQLKKREHLPFLEPFNFHQDSTDWIIPVHPLYILMRVDPSFFWGGAVFLGPYLQHMEVPRLGVESELQLPVYTTATRDPIHVCDLHHS